VEKASVNKVRAAAAAVVVVVVVVVMFWDSRCITTKI